MKKRTRDQWQELFLQHDTSGVSAAVFCQQHNLCPKYFSLRRKQLTQEAGEVETGFVRAHVKPETKGVVADALAASLAIHCHAGKLVFNTLPPSSWLAQLLRDLA